MLAKPTHILSISIPIITTVVFAVMFGQLIPLYCYATMLFGIPILLFLFGFVISRLTNRSTEYLGAYVTSITHYEAWNEIVLRTRQVEDGKDSNGMSKYRTEVYYETVYHPDEYDYVTNNGKCGNISEATFQHWRDMLQDQNPRFVEMYRDYYTINGNAWEYNWDRNTETMVPITLKQKYFNPLKYSNSIYKNKKIDKKTAEKHGLVEHPDIYGSFYQHCVIGDGRYPGWDLDVQRLNAKLGLNYQFRLFVIVFDATSKTQNVFDIQKAYWNNGNKNEFVLCVGINPKTKKLMWHNCFSWCKEPKLEAMVRNYLSTKETFDCFELCTWMETVVPNNWNRRQFSEFKYLDTKLPLWGNILMFIISIIATIGVGMWCL